MTWLLVAQLSVSIAGGQATSKVPKLRPAEAVAVLVADRSPYNRTGVVTYDGPKVITIWGSPTAGPFGELRSTPIQHPREPAAYINGGAVSAAGLEQFTILSGALNSVIPNPATIRSAPGGRR